MDDILFKIIMAICIIGAIIGLGVAVVELFLKGWLVVEGVKAIENAGGLSGLLEKLFQIFS